LRNGKLHVDVSISQLLLEAVDQLKSLMSVARGDSQEAPDSQSLIFQMEEAISSTGHVEEVWDEDALRAQIAKMLAEQDAAEVGAVEHPPTARLAVRYRFRFVPGANLLRQGMDPSLPMNRFLDEVTVIDLKCDTSALPPLQNLDPEISYMSWDVEFETGKEPA